MKCIAITTAIVIAFAAPALAADGRAAGFGGSSSGSEFTDWMKGGSITAGVYRGLYGNTGGGMDEASNYGATAPSYAQLLAKQTADRERAKHHHGRISSGGSKPSKRSKSKRK